MIKPTFVLLTLTAGAFISQNAQADVKMPTIFTDNMMFQRDQPIRVWGWAEPGEDVSVTFATKSATAKADEKGDWKVELPAMKEGENLELTVKGKNPPITLKNIILGDIWVCSGQSNMEWTMKQRCLNFEEDAKDANFPKIRRIKFKHVQKPEPQPDAPAATPWQICTPESCISFTAVGFYFAREINTKKNVPIGLIDSNWGGTRIEPWISGSGAASIDPAKAGNMKGYSGMYNAMIHPVINLPIKGSIWYQGESNGNEGETYRAKMEALVGGWRKEWKQGDFPFYWVQLASFQNPIEDPAGGNEWARLREAQTKSLSMANTGMAVIIDTVPFNERGDIHPKNKYDVGLRLARWALARDYAEKDLDPSGPLFKALKIEGGKARVEFAHADSGLMVGKKEGRNPTAEDKEGKLKRFAIAGADKKWFWAEAVIDKNTVVLTSPDVKEPVAVRYAFEMNPDGANLYDKDGLPASPFRTDDW